MKRTFSEEQQHAACFKLLGINVNPISHEQILARMGAWIGGRQNGHTVVAANTHVIIESRQNIALGQAVSAASLVVPDGMPLVVAARWRGFPLKSRADGPGLMLKALSEEPFRHWRHYFYGSTPEVLRLLRSQFPDATIAGVCAPPFRPLAPEEEKKMVGEINAARVDVVWVGLGCPKQEIWMQAHRDQLQVPVLVGVGQAFDVLAGAKLRAPHWMQNAGLEWLYRLIREPGRLWKRYFTNNSKFLVLVILEQIKIILNNRKFRK